MKIKLSIFLLLLITLVGCSPKNYQDINASISYQPLPVPEGEYASVAWHDKDHIAFIYKPKGPEANNTDEDFRIGIFEISTGNIKDLISLPLTYECYTKRIGISNLSRLPDGSLGFIYACPSSEYSLYLFDLNSNEFVKRQTYLGFIAKSFSFSPDMSQLVQENGSGGGLSEKLLLVSSDNTLKELLPDFRRARSPAWSSDSRTIAFAGTKDNPKNNG